MTPGMRLALISLLGHVSAARISLVSKSSFSHKAHTTRLLQMVQIRHVALQVRRETAFVLELL